VACELEERVQAGALARAEAVAELLEVAREEAGGVAVPLRRFERELLRLGAGETHRGDERVLKLGEPFRERFRTSPDGEHHRQAGPLEPEAAEVVVRRRILERRAQGSVADQEPRLGLSRLVR